MLRLMARINFIILMSGPVPLPQVAFKTYRMSNTSPTPLRSMRFTEPRAYKCDTGPLLQFFSLCFAGSFVRGESMSIYGFLAIRDDIDYLRNYVFCRSREDAHVIRPGSPDLPLISPVRGISWLGIVLKLRTTMATALVMTVKSLMAVLSIYPGVIIIIKKRSHESTAHLVLWICSSCISVMLWKQLLMLRLNGLQKVIILSVTAFTSGHPSGILLYDRPASSVVTSDNTPSAWMAVASSVVAVELDGELKLAIDVCVEDNPARGHVRADHNREVKQVVQTHELSFTAQK